MSSISGTDGIFSLNRDWLVKTVTSQGGVVKVVQMAGKTFQVLDPLLLHSSPKFGHHHIIHIMNMCANSLHQVDPHLHVPLPQDRPQLLDIMTGLLEHYKIN